MHRVNDIIIIIIKSGTPLYSGAIIKCNIVSFHNFFDSFFEKTKKKKKIEIVKNVREKIKHDHSTNRLKI